MLSTPPEASQKETIPGGGASSKEPAMTSMMLDEFMAQLLPGTSLGSFARGESAAGSPPQSPMNSRPPSRVAYMKPRVDEVTANPPPGIYESHLTVHLQSVTPGVNFMYTLDGSTPYENSDRDHGYRCAKYSPQQGIHLAGVGKHVLTVVATANKHIDSRPRRFVYRITAGDETPRPRSEMLRMDALNRQFELTATRNEAMPYRLARESSFRARTMKPVHIALADTSNIRKIEDLKKSGLHVELFKINISPETSNGNVYRRVVAPSLSLTVPEDPLKERKPSIPQSLRSVSHAITYTAPRSYAQLDRPPSTASTTGQRSLVAAYNTDVGIGGGGLSRYGGLTLPPAASRIGSRAGTPQTALGSRPNSRMTMVRSASAAPSTAVLKLPRGSSMATHSQLSWFESRSNLTASDPTDDKEDVNDEARYHERNANAVASEVMRVGRISEKFEKGYGVVAPVTADIAADGRRLLAFVVTASNAKRTTLRQVMCAVPYAVVFAAVEKRSSTSAVELAALCGNAVGQRDIASALRELTGGSDGDVKISMPTPALLLLLRYIVWCSRKIPEAVLALAVQFKTEVVSVPAERSVTRVEAVALVDAYRRTRGHHPLALAQLQDAVFTQAKWGDMGDMALESWIELLQGIPIIDAALAEMQSNSAAPMYERSIPLY